ncbi:MAG: cell envelope integrity protein CreD [bacterium]
MEDSVGGFISVMRRSHMLRLVAVGFLALVLQIPIGMIGSLIMERQQRQQSAVAEISSKWGRSQALTGPALVIPYSHRWSETGPNGAQVTRSEIRHAIFLPEKIEIQGKVDTELRHRGIFSIPVYRLSLTVLGEFSRPDFADLGLDPGAAAWERAQLAIGISDAHAILEQAAVSWNGQRVGFLPGPGVLPYEDAGIHAVVGVAPGADRLTFSFPLTLNGSLGLYFVPFGQETIVDLESNWPSPSFQGNWLPSNRTVSGQGFSARWSVPFLGRNYPQAWTSEAQMSKPIEASRFGFNLIDPVDPYRMAARSVKYAGLYILLTFVSVWLTEVIAGLRVHPIQYLLLGAALCLFYLLELSLSEHLGFPAAYVAASLAVIAMVGAYSLSVFRSRPKAAVAALGVSALYGYLYVLLRNEDYALLIGSMGLFVILATVMVVTRRVDWYAIGGRERVQRGSPCGAHPAAPTHGGTDAPS